MSTTLVTLSNYLYESSRTRLVNSGIKFGINNIVSYDFEDIKNTEFYYQNSNVLDNKKFMGYWLWKPYIILENLKKLSDGDVLLYIDAGQEIIDDLSPLIELCTNTEPILLFGNANDMNAAWVKRDCFVLMECDEPIYWYSLHCDASLTIFRKNQVSIEFVEQWLDYCCNNNIITNSPNKCGKDNLKEYIDHRYDQSILSLLAQKHKINLYRMPSQFGNHFKIHKYRIPGEVNISTQATLLQVDYYSVIPYLNSFYGQLLNHHRTKEIINSIEDIQSPLPVSIIEKIYRKITNYV